MSLAATVVAAAASTSNTLDITHLGSLTYGLAAIGPGIGIGLVFGHAITEALALIGFIAPFVLP
jgi:F-type H+-transporting ATPase subunit c